MIAPCTDIRRFNLQLLIKVKGCADVCYVALILCVIVIKTTACLYCLHEYNICISWSTLNNTPVCKSHYEMLPRHEAFHNKCVFPPPYMGIFHYVG